MKRLFVLATLAACGAPAQPVLHPEVQPGPAVGARPNRVLVLPASCGSVEEPCPQEYIKTVDDIIRGGLEFAGINVVQAENLRAETRQRHEEHSSTNTTSNSSSNTHIERTLRPDDRISTQSSSDSTTTSHLVVLDGSNFEDLSVDERHSVIDKSGADSVAVVRIVIGGRVGVWAPNQNVEVQVKLGVNQGDSMAWAARCTASSNDFSTVSSALENAARCAIHGATGR